MPKRGNVPRVIVFNETKMVLYDLVSLEIRVKDTAGRIHRSRETFVSVGNVPNDVVSEMMYLEKHDPQRDYSKREVLWKDEVTKVPVSKQLRPPQAMSKPLIAGVFVLLACVNTTIEEKTS